MKPRGELVPFLQERSHVDVRLDVGQPDSTDLGLLATGERKMSAMCVGVYAARGLRACTRRFVGNASGPLARLRSRSASTTPTPLSAR